MRYPPDLPPVLSLHWVKWQAHAWAEYVLGWKGCVQTFWAVLPPLQPGVGSSTFQRAATLAREAHA